MKNEKRKTPTTNFGLIFIGLAGGFAVGSGFVAFITVLDLLPRLVQMTQSRLFLRYFEWAIILGVLFFTCVDFFDWTFLLSSGWLILLGLFMGGFIGMLAAALTEVVNVIPILSRRLQVHDYLFLLFLALALGKTVGSLVQWIIF